MRSIKQIIKILQDYKEILRKRYGVRELGVFGSYLRNEAKKNSDVDILVEFDRTIDLLEFVELENYLSRILKVKTDLVMKDALKPRIGRYILEEVVYL